jgi:hypothetical protein
MDTTSYEYKHPSGDKSAYVTHDKYSNGDDEFLAHVPGQKATRHSTFEKAEKRVQMHGYGGHENPDTELGDVPVGRSYKSVMESFIEINELFDRVNLEDTTEWTKEHDPEYIKALEDGYGARQIKIKESRVPGSKDVFISYLRDGEYEIHHQQGSEESGKKTKEKINPLTFVSPIHQFIKEKVGNGYGVRIIASDVHINDFKSIADTYAKKNDKTVTDIEPHYDPVKDQHVFKFSIKPKSSHLTLKTIKGNPNQLPTKELSESTKQSLKSILNRPIMNMSESAAPGMEDWIKANKKEFIDQYGEKKGTQILYATAWKIHDKKLNEMVMDAINHPKLGRVEWRNDGGFHVITSVNPQGQRTEHTSGTHAEIAKKWAMVKDKLLKESADWMCVPGVMQLIESVLETKE